MTTPSSKWIVYILQCADNTMYTGITNDLESRVQSHNNGTGAKYTRGRSPVKVVYTEKCIDRSEATKKEREIKILNRTSKLKLIEA